MQGVSNFSLTLYLPCLLYQCHWAFIHLAKLFKSAEDSSSIPVTTQGGELAPMMKRKDAHWKCWKEPLTGTKILFLWAWLEMFFTPNKYQFKNDRLSLNCHFFFLANCPKVTVKASAVDILRLNTLACTKTALTSTLIIFIWESSPYPWVIKPEE